MIDLIALDGAGDRVRLSMVEEREWGSSEEQLDQLQEKFNNYLDYVLDGWMYRQYPQYAGKKAVFRLEARHEPTAGERALIAQMESYARSAGIEFELHVGSASSAGE